MRVGVHFYAVDQRDWLSRIVNCYVRLKGERLVHCALALDKWRYDCTTKGITSYTDEVEMASRNPVLTITWDVSDLAYHVILVRVNTLWHMRTKIRLNDFLKFATGDYNDVFLCTDFVLLVLGLPTHPFTPEELAEFIAEYIASQNNVGVLETRALP